MTNKKQQNNKTNMIRKTYKFYWNNMIYFVLFVLLCSFLITPQKNAKAGILSRPPTNLGLMLYWNFDEGRDIKMGDSSGQNNMGTNTNPSWVNGKRGGALNFNGTSNYVYSSNSYASGTSFPDVTISAWIKTTSASGKKIIGFENSQTGTASVSYDRHLYVNTNGKAVMGVYDTAIRPAVSNSTVTTGEWVLVTGTFNDTANLVKIYINGKFEAQTTASYAQSYTGYWRVGSYKLNSWTLGSDGYFPGSIDDVRIYNRTLTDAEIFKLYSSGSTKVRKAPTLVQSATCFIGGNTCTINITNTAGNLLWVGINDYSVVADGYIYSVSDTKGNTYSTASPATDTGNVNGPQLIQTFYVANIPAGANTITCSRGSHNGGSGRCVVLEYSGLATASPLNGHAENTNSGTSYTTGSLTTTNANDLLIGYFASRMDQSWSGLSWTSRFQNNVDFGVLVQDKLVSAKGQYEATATASNSNLGVGAINAFKSANGSMVIGTSYENRLTNGLVGFWTMNGKDYNAASSTAEVLDKSGQGNNGDNVGAIRAIGKLGQALNFNGTTNGVVVPDTSSLDLASSLTLSVWFYGEDSVWPSAYQGIVSKRPTSGGSANYGFNIYNYTSPNSNDCALVNGLQFYFSNGSWKGIDISTNKIPTRQWVHVVGIFEDTGADLAAKVYINGVLEGSATCSSTSLAPVNGPLYIGKSADSIEYFKGKIDEVRIYNRALSADEVRQLYNMGK